MGGADFHGPAAIGLLGMPAATERVQKGFEKLGRRGHKPPDQHPVRFLDAFVEGLDLKACGFVRTEPAETGRPPFAPGDLLKLYSRDA